MPRLRRPSVPAVLALIAGAALAGCAGAAPAQPAPRCGDPVTRDVPGRGSYVLTRLRIAPRPALPSMPAFAGEGASSEAR